MAEVNQKTLHNHLLALKNDERVFENALQSISRMILDSEIEKVVVNGKTYFVEYVSRLYREFLNIDRNRKYSFRFVGMDKIGHTAR